MYKVRTHSDDDRKRYQNVCLSKLLNNVWPTFNGTLG